MSIRQRRQILWSGLGLCLLGGAVYLTLALISPPSPLPADVPDTVFSAGRAMQNLEVIAREPRPMGEFAAHAAARDFLLNEIRSLDLEPHVQDTFGVRFIPPGAIIGGAVENILVRVPGSNPGGAILLIAHYDSTPGGPGAGDNGSGVVILLELLRNLKADLPLRQDVIFFFSDGHEPGIIGTHAFAAQHPWVADVRLIINVDFRAGAPTLAGTYQANGLWIEALARTALRPGYLSLPLDLFPSGDNDLLPFQESGLPGANFGSSLAAQEIHTSADSIDIVDPGAIQQSGNHFLALLRYLGEMPFEPDSEALPPEQTFFPVLGKLVHYPLSWVAPLATAVSLLCVGVTAFGLGRGKLSWKGMGVGFLTLLVFILLSLAITQLAWVGIQALHPEYEYSTLRPHLNDDYLFASGFTALGLAVAGTSIVLARRWSSAIELAAGVSLVWAAVGIVVAFLVPESSYLVTWPLLANSLALLLAMLDRSGGGVRAQAGLAYLAGGVLSTFLWLPVAKSAFMGLSFSMNWLVIGLAVLWLAAMLPALDWITSPRRWLLPSAALVSGTVLLTAGHILVGKNSLPPLTNPVGYWLEADSREACWIAFIGGSRINATTSARYEAAFPDEMDERQIHLLADPIRRPYEELFPEAPPFSVLTSEAPLLDVGGPGFEILSDGWMGDHRAVRVHITASMLDRVYVIIPESSLLAALTVPRNERIELCEPNEWHWFLRFDGTPSEGVELLFEFSDRGPLQFLLVEEKTGLPNFPGFVTQPERGTMPSPGEFPQGSPGDFTAVYRSFQLPALAGQ